MTSAPLDLTDLVVAGPNAIGLRPETDADQRFTRDLYATQRAAELALTPWDEAMRAAFIDHQFTAQRTHLRAHRPHADYLIVTRDDRPIGRLYLDRTVSPWRIAELALLPDELGKGVGAALIAWVLDAARADGGTGVDLHVTTDNPRAAAFYARQGFVEAPSAFEGRLRMVHTLDVS